MPAPAWAMALWRLWLAQQQRQRSAWLLGGGLAALAGMVGALLKRRLQLGAPHSQPLTSPAGREYGREQTYSPPLLEQRRAASPAQLEREQAPGDDGDDGVDDGDAVDVTARALEASLNASGDGLFQALSVGGSLPSRTPRGWRVVRVVPLGAWQQQLAPPQAFEHPHVAQLFGVTVDSADQCARIDVERTDLTVRELVATGELQRLSAKCRLRLCAQLASGLGAVHAANGGTLWHGLIRDDSCLIVRGSDGDLTAKLCEFGVPAAPAAAQARLQDMRGGWWPAEAADLVAYGTALDSLDGQRMDVFGLGAVVSILLSAVGSHPFGSPSRRGLSGLSDELEQRIADGAPVLNTLIPVWPTSLLRFLLRMLGSPASRRPTAAEGQETLAAAWQAAADVAPPAAVSLAAAQRQRVGTTATTPLTRAVAAAGGLDNWHGMDAQARRAAIEKALDTAEGEQDEEELAADADESSVLHAASFTSQQEADVDAFLVDLAAMAEAPTPPGGFLDHSAALLSDEEVAFDSETDEDDSESPEAAIDAILFDLARTVEQQEEEDDAQGADSERSVSFAGTIGETAEEAVDAFLAGLARTIEGQLEQSPVSAGSPVWREQEEEAEEYLRDVSIRENHSVMSLTRAAMAIADSPSKAAAAAAEILDQALTDLEAAAVGRVEAAAMVTSGTPTKAAFAAADVLKRAMLELDAAAALRSPVSPELDGGKRQMMRWSSPSDSIVSPISKELSTNVAVNVARRKVNAGSPLQEQCTADDATATVQPASMPPVPAGLRRRSVPNAEEEQTHAAADEPEAMASADVEVIVDAAASVAPVAITSSPWSPPPVDDAWELDVAQSQVDVFLADIKTITLEHAVQHAIKREEIVAKREEVVALADRTNQNKQAAVQALAAKGTPRSANVVARQQVRADAAEMKMVGILVTKFAAKGCDEAIALDAMRTCGGQIVKATHMLRGRFNVKKGVQFAAAPAEVIAPVQLQVVELAEVPARTVAAEWAGSAIDEPSAMAAREVEVVVEEARTLSAPTAIAHLEDAGPMSADVDDASEEVTLPLQACRGARSSVRRRVAMTKRFTQLKDTIANDPSPVPSLPDTPTQSKLLSDTSGQTAESVAAVATAAPLSPQSAADRESRERTRLLGARLLALAARKPGLAKAAEAHGLVSSMAPLTTAPSLAVRSPSEVVTLISRTTSAVHTKQRDASVAPPPPSLSLVFSAAPSAKLSALSKGPALVNVNDENAPTPGTVRVATGKSPVSSRRKGKAGLGAGSQRRRGLSILSMGNAGGNITPAASLRV